MIDSIVRILYGLFKMLVIAGAAFIGVLIFASRMMAITNLFLPKQWKRHRLKNTALRRRAQKRESRR